MGVFVNRPFFPPPEKYYKECIRQFSPSNWTKIGTMLGLGNGIASHSDPTILSSFEASSWSNKPEVTAAVDPTTVYIVIEYFVDLAVIIAPLISMF